MSESRTTPGKTTIAPDVLLTIARLTTLSVPGVSRLSAVPGGVNRLFKRTIATSGVQIEIDENVVNADIYVTLDSGMNVREVSRKIQFEVSRAISKMVGMDVGRISIHIEDIDYHREEM